LTGDHALHFANDMDYRSALVSVMFLLMPLTSLVAREMPFSGIYQAGPGIGTSITLCRDASFMKQVEGPEGTCGHFTGGMWFIAFSQVFLFTRVICVRDTIDSSVKDPATGRERHVHRCGMIRGCEETSGFLSSIDQFRSTESLRKMALDSLKDGSNLDPGTRTPESFHYGNIDYCFPPIISPTK